MFELTRVKYLRHRCRTSYIRSFLLPSYTHYFMEHATVQHVRCCSRKPLFKTKLTAYLKVKFIVPKKCHTGNRRDQMNICQIRLNFASLNGDLYNKSFSPSPMCRPTCGPDIESAGHYFLHCSNYTL